MRFYTCELTANTRNVGKSKFKMQISLFQVMWEKIQMLLILLKRSRNWLLKKISSIAWASQVALVVKNPPANAGNEKRHGFDPWVGKILWRRAWKTTPVFLPGEFPGAWWATVHSFANSWTLLKWLSMHTCKYFILHSWDAVDGLGNQLWELHYP